MRSCPDTDIHPITVLGLSKVYGGEGSPLPRISTPSAEVFQLSKHNSSELKELFNSFLLLNSVQSSPAC